MASISVKRVKCGDSSIIKNADFQMIIDCGSDNSFNGQDSRAFAYSAIQDDINNEYNTSLLITHFDNDHFNGILNVPDTEPVFQNIYLPFSIVKENINYADAISKLLLIASPRSWGFRLSKRIVELFVKLERLVSNFNNIYFVKDGDTINFSDMTINILWPNINYDIENITIEEERVGLPEERRYLVDSAERDNHEITLKSFNSSLESEFNYLINDIMQKDRINEEFIGLRIEFHNTFAQYLAFLNDSKKKDNPNNNLREELEKNFNEILKANKTIRENTINDEELCARINRFARAQYHSLIKTMNAISIVFDYEDKFIFLGDATKDIVEFLYPRFKERYQIVKVQHHGTLAHYTQFTPRGDKYIISNGGFKARKVGGNIIRDFDGNTILCTNAHENANNYCSFYRENRVCSARCQQMHNNEVIDIDE